MDHQRCGRNGDPTVVVEVPYDDHWYLVVDGYEGRIKVKFTEIVD